MSPSTPGDASSDDIRAVDLFLAAALRDEATLPTLPHPDLVPERALYHGVSALLASLSSVMAALPPHIQAALRQQALAETMWDLGNRQIIVPLLQDLQRAKVQAVLLKGTALAYSVYGSPAQRPRGDTDILVGEAQIPAARAVLARHGFQRAAESEIARTPQEHWSLDHPDFGTHEIDLHWNLLSSWALSPLFDTGAILMGALDVPLLGQGARMLAPDTALLHACIHRAQHFSVAYFIGNEFTYRGDRLIWFVDMDLLCRSLKPEQWETFIDDALRTGTARIAHEALLECQKRLGTPVSTDVMTRLNEVGGSRLAEHYLLRGSFLNRLRADMRSLPIWGSRMAYLRQIFLPEESVIRQEYPELANRSLARLHLRRYRERFQRLRKKWKQRSMSS